MKVVICSKPGVVSLADWPEPQPGAGEVLVQIRRIGVCGTDMHIFLGDQPFVEYPRIMGHELSGSVASAPANSALEVGSHVIINPYLACGKCVACRKGKPNCCTAIKVLGVHSHGGLCEMIAVPECAVIPARSLTLDEASMVECLAIGAHAVRRGETARGDRVLVAGLGPIGLGTALFARLTGADVTVTDTNLSRLDKAAGVFGFTRIVAVTQNTQAEFRELTDGDFFDVVFDATGNAAAIEAGFANVAHGGSYVLVSVVKDDITFSDPEFHKREMRLIGSRNATSTDFEHVIRQIEAGKIPTADLHTHSCSLADFPDELTKWIADPDNVVKAIVRLDRTS